MRRQWNNKRESKEDGDRERERVSMCNNQWPG